jgi:hypothetical protein
MLVLLLLYHHNIAQDRSVIGWCQRRCMIVRANATYLIYCTYVHIYLFCGVYLVNPGVEQYADINIDVQYKCNEHVHLHMHCIPVPILTFVVYRDLYIYVYILYAICVLCNITYSMHVCVLN